MAEKNQQKNKKTATKKLAKKPENESKKLAKKPASKSELKIGLFIGLVAVVAGIVIAILCLSKGGDPSDPKAKLSYADSFFIYDDGKYTLWNADGRRLTEDEYTYASGFVAGYAYVKKDEQTGIINQSGNMTVEMGKYGDISARNGLFFAQDGNTKEYHLLTGDGRDLLAGKELEVTGGSSSSGFAMAKYDDYYYVYNYSGKQIVSTEGNEGADEPEIYASNDFGAFCYDNQNWVFDARDGRMIANFEGPCYSFESVSENRSTILMQNNEDSEKYKLLTGGKQYDLDEAKYYAITVLGDVIGYNSFTELALLDENYKVAVKVGSDLALKDYKNYATLNDDGEAKITRNGEIVATFDNEAEIQGGVLYADYYAIKNGESYKFYHLDGTVAINHEFYDIDGLFDENQLAVVADEEDVYYLINTKGERVTDWTAEEIVWQDGGYELENSDGDYAIADKKGELVTDFKYDDVYYRSNVVGHNIWTGRNSSNNYDVIDVDSHKVLLENVNPQDFLTNYFTVKNDDGKTEYYTYKGERLDTTEK